MSLIYHPHAQDDLVEAARYYDEQRLGLGEEFLAEVSAAVQEILATPLRFQIVSGEARRCRVSRFPYCLFFRPKGDDIQIVAVRHHRRRPNSWKYRLRD